MVVGCKRKKSLTVRVGAGGGGKLGSKAEGTPQTRLSCPSGLVLISCDAVSHEGDMLQAELQVRGGTEI